MKSVNKVTSIKFSFVFIVLLILVNISLAQNSSDSLTINRINNFNKSCSSVKGSVSERYLKNSKSDNKTNITIIPIANIIGGTDISNNAKTNPNGGYYSFLNSINEFSYSSGHNNVLGNTALCNDHVYWDTDGLQYSHVPPPDNGGGNALWWPCVNEWVSYEFSVSSAGAYRIPIRFSSGWGPDSPVYMHITIDGISSGSFILQPDDPIFWHDTYSQVNGWWGHTIVNGTCPYTWSLAKGKHILKVIVDDLPSYQGVDQDSNHGWIWIHYFKVKYVGPPDGKWISIIKPVVDTSYIAPANLNLEVLTESGDSAIVDRVAFFNGSEKIGEALEAPYSFNWSGVGKGIYDISAMILYHIIVSFGKFSSES